MASDTIAARATPAGFGGIGIIRVSGPDAAPILEAITGRLRPQPRCARLELFRDGAGEPLDQGVTLWFPGPASYTGEDLVELQGHGGPAVLDAVLARTLELGARLARPGEFTERAFLNGRLDLAQAEAVADLIETSAAAGARAAMRSLSGAFSARIHSLSDELTAARAWLEAALDFPEEEIDFLAETDLASRLMELGAGVASVRAAAQSGQRLIEGVTIVLAGAPNAGKSSLLNRLAGSDAAIVTAIPGTTRELLREPIRIGDMPVTVIDTAGLRLTDDPIESEGVRRARAAVAEADRVLLIVDATEPTEAAIDLPAGLPIDRVYNKIDLAPGSAPAGALAVSARTGSGLDELREHLQRVLATPVGQETAFSARRRHLDALDRAADALAGALRELNETGSGELAAEQLRSAQEHLGVITGTVTTEDLLGEIFGRFCIGK